MVCAYVVSISLVTFGFYGYDKLRAVRQGFRVPEQVLHTLTILGGTLGGMAGQRLFRHKTSSSRFQVRFTLILLIQVAAMSAYYWYY